jgi:hypothetical protein
LAVVLNLASADDVMPLYRLKNSASASALGILALSCAILAILVDPLADPVLAQISPDNEPDIAQLKQGKAYIYKLNTVGSAGKGYKLVYMVAAPLAVYWKFKTDFENDFLLTNKLIKEHRLVAYSNNVAITESIYATKPGVIFRWRTISSPDIHRLDFELENPKECGQTFHYGHIQLKAAGDRTIVTQTAYFDFFGATLWMNYPWYGGMRHYLKYTARWEQETITRLIDRYR